MEWGIRRTINQVEQVAAGIPEEEHTPASARGLDWFREGDALLLQNGLGGLDTLYPKRQMPEAGQVVQAHIGRDGG
jgi:hypothetical protein